MRTVLYLHGVGQGYREDGWFDALNASLEAQGVTTLGRMSRRLVAPDYIDILKSPPSSRKSVDEPTITKYKVGKDRARQLAWEYARAQEEALRGLTQTVDGDGLSRSLGKVPGLDLTKLPVTRDLKDAQRYVSNPALRHQIIHRVLSDLKGRTDLLIIGHSLGSVVAVDLLKYLPSQIAVNRIITLGSPLGQMLLHRSDPRRLNEDFPYSQVRSWVNVLSPWDLVTLGIGASPLFPAAVDVRIALPVGAHSASRYLSHPTVAQLLARSLAPPRTEFSATAAIDVRVSNEEEVVLNGLAYAGVVRNRLKGERKERYAEARRSVQVSVVDSLIRSRVDDGRPVPGGLLDAADGERVPTFASAQDLEQDLAFAIISATSNAVAPYDLDVSAKGHPDLVTTWVRLGYLSSDGRAIAKALEEAESAFKAAPWTKYAVGAVGLALVAAAPIGLLAAAPVGLAGAAAITSSLAAFGPGGMLGGMMLSGALIGTGSATAAFATVSLLNEDMLETEVVRRMAASLARRRLGLPDDDSNWRLFAYWHSELAAEHFRHESVSDEDSPTVRVLNRKLKVVRTAIRWMSEQELAPSLGTG